MDVEWRAWIGMCGGVVVVTCGRRSDRDSWGALFT